MFKYKSTPVLRLTGEGGDCMIVWQLVHFGSIVMLRAMHKSRQLLLIFVHMYTLFPLPYAAYATYALYLYACM